MSMQQLAHGCLQVTYLQWPKLVSNKDVVHSDNKILFSTKNK